MNKKGLILMLAILIPICLALAPSTPNILTSDKSSYYNNESASLTCFGSTDAEDDVITYGIDAYYLYNGSYVWTPVARDLGLLNRFNDSSTSKLLNFSTGTNQTVYVTVTPSDIFYGTSLSITTIQNVSNPYLDAGKIDGVKDWNYTGNFSGSIITDSFKSKLFSYFNDSKDADLLYNNSGGQVLYYSSQVPNFYASYLIDNNYNLGSPGMWVEGGTNDGLNEAFIFAFSGNASKQINRVRITNGQGATYFETYYASLYYSNNDSAATDPNHASWTLIWTKDVDDGILVSNASTWRKTDHLFDTLTTKYLKLFLYNGSTTRLGLVEVEAFEPLCTRVNNSCNIPLTIFSSTASGLLNVSLRMGGNVTNTPFSFNNIPQQNNASFRCFAQTKNDNSSYFTLSNIQINDIYSPIVNNIFITPTSPYSNDSIDCTFSVNDLTLGDIINTSTTWYKNNVSHTTDNENFSNVQRNTNISTTEGDLEVIDIQKHNEWKCSVTVTDGTHIITQNSSSVIIKNLPPSITGVTIAPSPAPVTSILTASATGSSDYDIDEVFYIYQWFKNGTLLSGQNTSSFNCSAYSCKKQSNVTCQITPYDGEDYGLSKNGTAVFQNTAPSISTLPDKNTSEDIAYPNALNLQSYTTDVDDTMTFTFYMVSQSNPSLVSASLTGTNISMGLPAGNQTGTSQVCVVAQDNDANSTQSCFNINVLQVNDAPAWSTIPNQNTNEDETPTINVDLYPYITDIESSASAFTYTLKTQSNSTIINCYVDSNRYVKCNQPGQNLNGNNTLTIQANDAVYLPNYNITTTFKIIVLPVNDAPSLQSVSLGPQPAYPGNDINCSPGTTTDIEGDSVYYNYTWYKNSNLTNFTTKIVNGSNILDGDIWKCEARACDYGACSDWKASNDLSIGAGNTPPVVNSLNPTGSFAGNITINCSATDTQNDSIFYTIDYKINGEWVNIVTDSSTGTATWDTSTIKQTTFNADLRCKPKDEHNYNGYYYERDDIINIIRFEQLDTGWLLSSYGKNQTMIFTTTIIKPVTNMTVGSVLVTIDGVNRTMTLYATNTYIVSLNSNNWNDQYVNATKLYVYDSYNNKNTLLDISQAAYVDSTFPQINSLSSDKNNVVGADTIRITANVTDAYSNLQLVNFTVLKPNSVYEYYSSTGSNGSTYYLDYSIDGNTPGNYTFYVNAKDSTNNFNSTSIKVSTSKFNYTYLSQSIIDYQTTSLVLDLDPVDGEGVSSYFSYNLTLQYNISINNTGTAQYQKNVTFNFTQKGITGAYTVLSVLDDSNNPIAYTQNGDSITFQTETFIYSKVSVYKIRYFMPELLNYTTQIYYYGADQTIHYFNLDRNSDGGRLRIDLHTQKAFSNIASYHYGLEICRGTVSYVMVGSNKRYLCNYNNGLLWEAINPYDPSNVLNASVTQTIPRERIQLTLPFSSPALLRVSVVAGSEASQVPGGSYQCNDGIDNDGDTFIDYPNDPGCSSATDNSEVDQVTPPPGGGGANQQQPVQIIQSNVTAVSPSYVVGDGLCEKEKGESTDNSQADCAIKFTQLFQLGGFLPRVLLLLVISGAALYIFRDQTKPNQGGDEYA